MGPATTMTPRCQGTTSPRAGVLGRSPGILTLGRDAGRARSLTAVAPTAGRGPGVGRGIERDQRGAVSVDAGLVPEHHPKVLPTPTRPQPRKEEESPTTRPLWVEYP